MISATTSTRSQTGVSTIAFRGWENNLCVANETVELVATLDVGPRILSYRKHRGFNPLHCFEDQAGTAGESVWRNRGGHRLWTAPEHQVKTYFPDNSSVDWEQLGEFHVKLRPPPETSNGIQKEIEIQLDPIGTGVTLVHRVTRIGNTPVTLAPWALSVMAAGGVAVVPQPEIGQHPRDLLPNRNLVLWPYTDMSDPRWHFGKKYILLRQDSAHGPTKIGLSHQPGWSGYLVGGVFFIKKYGWDFEASYPDKGCNLEIFTNARMLELESLGPLTELGCGESLEHVERWELHNAPRSFAANPEEQLDELIRLVLDK